MHSDEFYIENWNPRLLLGPESHFGIFSNCSYFHPHIITIVDVKVIPMTIYLLLPFKEFICGYNKVRKNLNAMILTHILPYKINFEEFTFSPPIMMIYIFENISYFLLETNDFIHLRVVITKYGVKTNIDIDYSSIDVSTYLLWLECQFWSKYLSHVVLSVLISVC